MRIQIKNSIKILLIGDYILDKMNTNQINMLPSPYRYFRDKYVEKLLI